jgi:hypothetical protein
MIVNIFIIFTFKKENHEGYTWRQGITAYDNTKNIIHALSASFKFPADIDVSDGQIADKVGDL